MSALPYDVIGSYRITGLLGRGGFAAVYRAVDDRLEDEVAVKVLADNYATDPDIRARFLSEGRLLRKIDNQHLIRVHDVGETERSQPYLVLELADSGDLYSRVSELRAAGWQPTRADISVVAEALLGAADALHANQLVHRDLKPDNVLLRSTSRFAGASAQPSPQLVRADERLMISDLGFSKDLAAHSGFTMAGGTAAFGAPEQFRGDRVTAQTDLFAIARILEWLIDGGPDSPGTAGVAGWHAGLRQAVAPALEEDPDRRPESAAQMLTSVRQALAVAQPSHPGDAGIPLTPLAPTSPTSPRRRSRSVVAAIGALVLTIGILGALLANRSSGAQPGDFPVVAISEQVGETSHTQDGSTVSIVGPLEVTLSEPVELIASGPPGTEFIWTMPDGGQATGPSEITIVASEPGLAVVGLEGLVPGGPAIALDYTIRATE